MKYLAEFEDNKISQKLSENISKLARNKKFVFMEVCGTHTMAIARFGIKSLLPENIKLLSGPGCPVCVTPVEFIDKAIALARLKDVIITTFGDMFKVPGSAASLAEEKAVGRDIRIVYSAGDSIGIAEGNPGKKVIFLGIGFETTSPAVAVTVLEAKKLNLKNFYVLSAFKIIPNALKILADDPELKLDGLICPGHLSTITGTRIYDFLARDYNLACVVTGFEPLDILQGIYMLVKQKLENKIKVENQYTRSVKQDGNPKALELLDTVFEPCDSNWRGIGNISGSGLKLKKEFKNFDAEYNFKIKIKNIREPRGCICGLILRGHKTPLNCRLFKSICAPTNPVGACMVSSEGTCAAYFKYGLS